MNWHGKRVLVTGAEGFIGSHLVKRLLEEGSLVHALVKKGSSLWRLQESIDRSWLWNRHCRSRCSYIRHIPFGTSDRLSSRRPGRRFAFLGADCASRPNKYHGNHKSALSGQGIPPLRHLFIRVLPKSMETRILPSKKPGENHPFPPIPFPKVAGTHFCQMAARTFDLPVTIVRLFPAYGLFRTVPCLSPRRSEIFC